jgi:hypothetical protein
MFLNGSEAGLRNSDSLEFVYICIVDSLGGIEMYHN